LGGLDGGELQMGAASHFDPTRPQLKSQLVLKLGLSQSTAVEEMQGHRGGLNEGVWVLRDQERSFVMKLVKGSNKFGIPTEAERFFKLYKEHPSIINDPSVAFPTKIFRCAGSALCKRLDLIVMRKASGELLSTHIAGLLNEDKLPRVMKIFKQLGRFLADFHSRYSNKQHNDLQPSNIVYDPATSRFTLIDVGDLGTSLKLVRGNGRETEPEADVQANRLPDDVERFTDALGILSTCYGQNFHIEGKRHFEAGYTARKNF